MNVLIDGVLFQFAARNSADAEACRAILRELASESSRSGVIITILDRGGAPQVDGARVIAFPSFRSATPAADAVLVQRLCNWLATDLFVSTGLTTPISTPTLQLLVGSNLGLVEFGRTSLDTRRDCEIAVGYSTFLICLTAAMEAACRLRYPDLVNARIPELTEWRPLGTNPRADKMHTMSDQILALGRQAVASRSGIRKAEVLGRWSKVREIQAALEV